MVKTRQQKSKPKKQHPQVKTQGKQTDISRLRAQLDALGLQIIQVTADGNCFFRALADQLEGDEEQHGKYRSMVVQYIAKNREMFEPFIEDDVPFDEYCQSMEKDGTWAGHMEVQAASLVTRRNICIHRNMSPRWYIKNFDERGAHMVHLSYHDEEHYNSVRLKEDPNNGPAMPIIIKADADISASTNQAKAAVSKPKGAAGKDSINTGSIKMVMAGSGCESAEKVEQVLLQVDGDVDAAIEFLVAEQGTEDYAAESDSLTHHVDGSYGNDDVNSEKHKEEALKKTFEQDASSDSIKTLDDSSSRKDDKKIPRNKICPCGSKKKYKACCGSVSGRSSTKFIVNQTTDARKGKKVQKQGKKGASAKSAASSGSEGGPPDMGLYVRYIGSCPQVAPICFLLSSKGLCCEPLKNEFEYSWPRFDAHAFNSYDSSAHPNISRPNRFCFSTPVYFEIRCKRGLYSLTKSGIIQQRMMKKREGMEMVQIFV